MEKRQKKEEINISLVRWDMPEETSFQANNELL